MSLSLNRLTRFSIKFLPAGESSSWSDDIFELVSTIYVNLGPLISN